MSTELKGKVYVNGKLITLEELQQQYQQITIAGTPSVNRIMNVLSSAKKPLTRRDIAKEVKLTAGHTRSLLKKLVAQELVIEIKLGSNANYYLLTEKGLKALQK